MCIALVSTAHPDYPLILLDNRDEFLHRPTARADWWEAPNEHVLGGRDLQRAEHGTWMGVTKQGRFAVLTNFREEGSEIDKSKSRGGIVTQWLMSKPKLKESPEQFIERLIRDTGINDVGGFSLWVGQMQAHAGELQPRFPGIVVASNRTANKNDLVKIVTGPNETTGLSNSYYGDRSWPKVVKGEELLAEAISKHVRGGASETSLIDALFEVLSTDTMPRQQPDESWLEYSRQLRNSIFIPLIGGSAVEQQSAPSVASADGSGAPKHASVTVGTGIYGTQQQTVVLVDQKGRVKFVQRTLYDKDGHRLAEKDSDVTFEFHVES